MGLEFRVLMEVIKILPHHAVGFFRVFYLGQEPEKMYSWYDSERMKHNGADVVNKVVGNPTQLVQIVSHYDSICSACPRNKQNPLFNNNFKTACSTYDSFNPDTAFAKRLGLEEVMDKEPITAQRFLDLINPAYDKLISEGDFDEFGKKKTLRQLFGEERKYTNAPIISLFVKRI